MLTSEHDLPEADTLYPRDIKNQTCGNEADRAGDEDHGNNSEIDLEPSSLSVRRTRARSTLLT